MTNKTLNLEEMEDLDFEECTGTTPYEDVLGNMSILTHSNYRTILSCNESTYMMYFGGQVEAPEVYTDLFIFLRSLRKNDDLTIYINSPGGDLVAAIQIIHAIQDCKAKTTAVIDGCCYSCAPVIAFSCDKVVIGKHASVMFHNSSADRGRQKANEALEELNAISSLWKDMQREYCSGILTKEELDNVMHGRDYYFNAKQLKKRLKGK